MNRTLPGPDDGDLGHSYFSKCIRLCADKKGFPR
jgi:hypothetical protein